MSANGVVTAVVETERRRRGLTRSQLAELLGVNAMYVSRKLNGLQRWSMDDLDRISERLELPLPILLMQPVGPVVTLQSRPSWVVTYGYQTLRLPTLRTA